jgi:TonB-linked SusC/RagA family outer membrane protein
MKKNDVYDAPKKRRGKKLNLKMKFCFFLASIMLFQLSANSVMSQKKMEFNYSNVPLKRILNEIKSQTGYRFFYSLKEIDDQQKTSLTADKETVREVLNRLADKVNFDFKINGNQIVLINKEITSYQSQAWEIEGTVKDEEGNPLPGASIVEKGTTNGTQTDFDGKFILNLADANATLVFSYIGFASTEVEVNGQTTIHVQLKESTSGLEEVIVVGYGSQRKADITGSVVRVTTEKTGNIPNSNVLQTIQGQVSGLNVTTGNTAGSNSSVRIRGENSLTASNNPLLVIDNVIYNGDVSDFNPNDIESIDILKDASSTAIYGARAANGVLLITTKKGRYGKPKFKFNTYTGFQFADKLIDVLDGPGFEQKIADYNVANPSANITLTDIEEANKANGIQTDWIDRVTRTGIISNYQLDVSGGTEKINYYVSGALFDEEGIVVNDNFKRLNLNLNLSTKLTNWWSLGINSTFVTRDLSGIPAGIRSAYGQSPYGSFLDENGPGGFARLPVGDALSRHPFMDTLIDEEAKSESLRGVISSKIDIPFIEGLNWTMNYGANIRNDRTNSFTNNLLTTASIAQNGIAEKLHERNFDWTLDNILNYTRNIRDKHRIDLTLLYSRESRDLDLTEARANDFVSQELGFNALGLGAVQQSRSRREAQNSLSQMGRLNYAFDNKYAFTYSIRRDGFSAFAENNKYAIFQAGAFAWTMSNEAFLENSEWLNYLKLRLSYGENGNQGIDRFSSLSRINTNQYLFGNGGSSISTFNISTLANSELTWETTTSKNLGLDFQIFDNKISGSFDAYISNTKDLLQLRSIPSITGFENVLTNIGEVENKGFEFSLNSKNFDNPNFGWDTSIVFSLSRNKIISLGGVDADADGIEDDDIANGWFIGQPLNAIYGFKTDGIYQLNDTDILSGYIPGDFRIVDKNGDGAITPDDRQILGFRSPNYIVSLGNTFRYKSFSLYVLINSTQGGGSDNFYLGDNFDTRSVNQRGFSTYTERFNIQNVPYWTPNNPTDLYPRLDYVAPFDHPILEDRSFVRIQDVSFAYDFNDRTLTKFGFSNLQMYVSLKNVQTLTNWSGYNPETGTSVRDTPRPSSYTFGLNFGF